MLSIYALHSACKLAGMESMCSLNITTYSTPKHMDGLFMGTKQCFSHYDDHWWCESVQMLRFLYGTEVKNV